MTFSGTYGMITCMKKKNVKKDKKVAQDDLLPEYDLEKLRVRGVGPERKSIGGKPVILLESDVAEVFPDAVSVNEALRFLIRMTKANNAAVDVT